MFTALHSAPSGYICTPNILKTTINFAFAPARKLRLEPHPTPLNHPLAVGFFVG
jgi:hypothetical protein